MQRLLSKKRTTFWEHVAFGHPGMLRKSNVAKRVVAVVEKLPRLVRIIQASGRWISLGGQKAGLWLEYDVCVEGGMLRSVTSPAQRGRSDAVAAGRSLLR